MKCPLSPEFRASDQANTFRKRVTQVWTIVQQADCKSFRVIPSAGEFSLRRTCVDCNTYSTSGEEDPRLALWKRVELRIWKTTANPLPTKYPRYATEVTCAR